MKQILLAASVIVALMIATPGGAFAGSTVATTDTFFHVKERGLTFDKGIFLDGRQNIVSLDTRFAREDSMYFAPQLTGWTVVQGMVTMMWSMRVLSPTGKVLFEGGTGNKMLERYPIALVNDVPFMIELGKLKTQDPYYTVEFSITDKVSSKGVDGSFRVLLQ
jgi:hypothetical protein